MTIATTKHFTLDEYNRLAELGFFDEGDRVELIRGEIIQMIAKGTPHSVCGTRLNREMTKLIGDRATVRTQEPLQLLPNSAPEPDYAVVQNREDDYLASHPEPEDVVLVIEISDSSLSYDQNVKLKLYAESGIQNHWIFNLQESTWKYTATLIRRLKVFLGIALNEFCCPMKRSHRLVFQMQCLIWLKFFQGNESDCTIALLQIISI